MGTSIAQIGAAFRRNRYVRAAVFAEWAESEGAAKEATIRRRVVMGWSPKQSVFGVK
jgi:hypothetical protein